MAIQVRFYNFAKRDNSTKVPASSGTSFDCLLKQPSGILYPTIQLQLSMASPPLYNYAYIPAFHRYYWIREWTYEGRLWQADLAVDVLGSYKSDIGSASLYVLRAYAEKDGRITDTHYPLTTTVASVDVQQGTTWFGNVSTLSGGCFIVGLRGRINSDQTAGGITYLVMTPAQFKTFTDDLFNDQLNNYVTGGQSLDIGNSLALMIFNPTQYIASCIWLPGIPTSETPANGFNVGWWGFTSGSKIVSSLDALIYSASLTLAAHPTASTRGQYMNTAPFTQRLLNLPRYGVIDISHVVPSNASSVEISLTVDPISGQGLYRLYYKLGQTDVLFDEIQCQIGVEMPLSSNQVTIQEAAASLASAAQAVVDAASLNGVGAVADIASALQILQPHINDISQASGFLGYSNSVGSAILVSRFNNTAESDPVEEGYPLCKIRQPSNLGGFMQCLHGDLEIAAATASELAELRDYLTGGFYYE